MHELDYYFKLFNLKPSMFIAYDRLSYKEKKNKTPYQLRYGVDFLTELFHIFKAFFT